MHIDIKVLNLELTSALRDYAEKRMSGLEKFMHGESSHTLLSLELSKTTNHHKHGDIFRAEANLGSGGKTFRAASEKEDINAAIDDVREELMHEITKNKDKRQTLFRRGAHRVKNALKGFYSFKK